jgi:hypothetical protein
MTRDGRSAGAQRDDSLKIPGLVLVIGDWTAEAVELIAAWPPAGRIPLRDDAVDAIGR